MAPAARLVATMLCALRSLQERGGCTHEGLHASDERLLSRMEIDVLAERLNTGRAVVLDGDLARRDDLLALVDWIDAQSPDGSAAAASVARQRRFVVAAVIAGAGGPPARKAGAR